MTKPQTQADTLWSTSGPGVRLEADANLTRGPQARDERTTSTHHGASSQTAATQGATRLSREQILDRILDLSSGASTAFLADFDRATLADYLDRLTRLRDSRGKTSRWVRRPGPPAITQTRWMTARTA
ncbi:MAG: hypothetical protein AAF138_07675 [Planctomycetota bacterium]